MIMIHRDSIHHNDLDLFLYLTSHLVWICTTFLLMLVWIYIGFPQMKVWICIGF